MIASDHAVAASAPLTSFVRTARSGSSVQARCWISAIAVASVGRASRTEAVCAGLAGQVWESAMSPAYEVFSRMGAWPGR